MNLVECFFADLTQDCVREGSLESARELIEAIDDSWQRGTKGRSGMARKRARYPAQDRESKGGAASIY
jgi:hypothetical protein